MELNFNRMPGGIRMNKRASLSMIVLFLLVSSSMPVASAYSGKVQLPDAEDGVPGEYILYLDANWGDTIRWWFTVDNGAVNFLIFRPNLGGHYSISQHGTVEHETKAPESGTYMLVWRNKEDTEKVLQFRVDVDHANLSLLLAVVAILVIIGIAIVYLKWKRAMRQLAVPDTG
jgi:hypothetical protein